MKSTNMSSPTIAEQKQNDLPRKPPTKTSEHRRATKPIMEKRRRARINNSLNELKKLILDALNKDPSRHSKLEKADILEMTVRHLQSIQRQQMASAIATDPTVVNKYRAGYNECATEVNRYVGRIEGIDHSMRQRLVSHLNNCVQSLNSVAIQSNSPYANAVRGIAFPGMMPPNGQSPYATNTPLHVQIPMSASAIANGLFSASSTVCPTPIADINNNNSPLTGVSSISIDSKPSISTPPASASSTSSSHFTFSAHSPSLRHHHHYYTQEYIHPSSAIFRNVHPWNRSTSGLESPMGQGSISPNPSSIGSGQISPSDSDQDVDMVMEPMAKMARHSSAHDSDDSDSVWRPW